MSGSQDGVAHVHKWTVLAAPDKLQCTSCDTASSIDTLIANTEAASAQATRIQLLRDQLFGRKLKKKFHDEAYAWVMGQADADDPLRVEKNPQLMELLR